MSFILPKLFIVWKKIFQAFRSMANKRYKWYVTKSVYVAITTFFSWQKKKEQEITRSRMWTRIFRVKWCTIGMHNAMARIVLETNSSGDVSLGKDQAPLLQWTCWLKTSGLIISFTFVIMQVVLLNICLGQRRKKSRLQVAPQLQRKEKLVSQVR